SQFGLPAYDAKILCGDRVLADHFEACARLYPDSKKLANWFLGELLRLLNEQGASADKLKFTPAQFASLLLAVDRGEISAQSGKGVLAEMFRTGKEPGAIIAEKGLGQVSDASQIETLVDEFLAKNPSEVAKYRSGKTQVFGFFVGQVMRAMKGKGNPAVVNELLRKKLG